MIELHLTKKDFRLEWFSGSGAGGQHRNKHMNCCRITHIETGLKAQGTNSRSRVENQRVAFTNLAKMVISYYSATSEERRQWLEPIRNYHGVRNEVHDKASGLKLLYTEVINGDGLSEMVNARKIAMTSENLT